MKDYREAVLYEKLPNGAVRCRLCAHLCLIKPDRRGICGVRLNRDGTLYTLAYGRVIAAHVDPIEKKPLFHFLPGTSSLSLATVGCNFHCRFCQNWSISQAEVKSRKEIPGDDLSPEAAVGIARRKGCESISYTYTEPTIFFEYAADTARLARDAGLKNVFVSNGYQTRETVAEMAGLIDAANVDLKSFRDEFYRRLCGATLAPVLEAIAAMHEAGIFLEITTLLIPGRNDDPDELKSIAGFIADLSPDIPWHVSRFHPDFEMTDALPTDPGLIKRARQIGREAGLNYIFAGNLPGRGGEDTICPGCGETVIERSGFFVGKTDVTSEGRCKFCGIVLKLVMV